LSPHNWRCWNVFLEILQNFPFSETHQPRKHLSNTKKTKLIRFLR
jgi:hypothetical protein